MRRITRLADVLSWFIVDLTEIDNKWGFERSCKEVYHPELELKKWKKYYSEGLFLYLGIKIVHKKFNIGFILQEIISHFQ